MSDAELGFMTVELEFSTWAGFLKINLNMMNILEFEIIKKNCDQPCSAEAFAQGA